MPCSLKLYDLLAALINILTKRLKAILPGLFLSRSLKHSASFYAVLDEYARALRETGNDHLAISVQKPAEELSSKDSERTSITDRTPYGKFSVSEGN